MTEASPLYETTYALIQLVRESLLASGNDAPHLTTSAWTAVATLRAVVSDALRVRDAETVLRRVRDAEIVLDILRRDLYDMLRARALSAPMFDEGMQAVARCRRAALGHAAAARREAWARLHGVRLTAGRRPPAPPPGAAGAT
jgi:hypothetical protein